MSGRGTLRLGGLDIVWGSRTYLLAIINATADSFSGDGVYPTDSAERTAVELASRALDDGADVVDIGGMPSFAGAELVPWEVERDRVLPVVKAVAAEVDVPISVDTKEAGVARAALDAGASLVNSAWGLHQRDGGWNTELARVVADHDAALVLTHNRTATPAMGPNGPYYVSEYTDVLAEVIADLRHQLELAQECGVPRDRLIVDYGPGMGKGPEDSLHLVRNLAAMAELDAPRLLAHSRKNFIGRIVGGTPVDRDPATLATTAIGIAAGADMIRVHNVPMNKQAAMMADALVRHG
jgi:dihydropteroate synthase